jgi:hypothetical protein
MAQKLGQVAGNAYQVVGSNHIYLMTQLCEPTMREDIPFDARKCNLNCHVASKNQMQD